jgi:hypothetical protein
VGNFRNTKSVWKQRKRWEGIVERDVLLLVGVQGWRRQAGNTEEWRQLLREVFVQKGFTEDKGLKLWTERRSVSFCEHSNKHWGIITGEMWLTDWLWFC